MGDTWYDSLQVKVTKRYSHGLTAQVAYTFSKSQNNAANSNTSYLTPSDPVLNDPYNTPPSSSSPVLTSAGAGDIVQLRYPEDTDLRRKGLGKAVNWLARDWNIGGVLKYASGALIQSPASNITLWNTMGIGGTPLNGVSNFSGGGLIPNRWRTMFLARTAWPWIRTAISTRPKRWHSIRTPGRTRPRKRLAMRRLTTAAADGSASQPNLSAWAGFSGSKKSSSC